MNKGRWVGGHRIRMLLGLCLATAAAGAELELAGLGWWQELRLERSLRRLRAEPDKPHFTANDLEDAVFFLFSTLAEQGYLHPRARLTLTTKEGQTLHHEFTPALTELLPRPLQVTRAEVEVQRGVHYQFDEIDVQGESELLTSEQVRSLVLPRGSGLSVTPNRDYSPSILKRGLGRVEDALSQRGYAEAQVRAPDVRVDEQTGEVDVQLEIAPGPRWRVREVRIEGAAPPGVEWPALQERVGEPWTVSWEQDAMERVRRVLFRAGYPDATLTATRASDPAVGGERAVVVTVTPRPGPQVKLAEVQFAGEHGVKESVLRRRIEAEPGEPLNPLRFEAARYRLARLGAFEEVALHYEPAAGAERSVVFTLTGQPDWEVHLLAGYGSYEQLRGGFELRRNNVWGRAHQARLEAIQSMKSTSGDLTYTVPELFGERVDGTVQLFGLVREELAFVREEFGGTLSLRRRRLPWIDAEGTVSYTFQTLRNEENELTTRSEDLTDTTAASIDFSLSQDRRDNPLRPRRGYHWFAQAELAAQALGGEVDYQRLELGVSYHTSWGDSRWIHAALTHGAVLTLGSESDRSLPVNRRFYPGGDSSIRGYQLGEAAPRAADGRFLGAKSSTLLNLELEQALVGRWTGVLFLDVLGTAAELESYPWDEYLASIGVGIRYQTIIGPVRLEYGHNLRRREGDPGGTLHLSLGFPF